MYYLCKWNSERHWFNGNIIECKFFQHVFWYIGTRLYKLYIILWDFVVITMVSGKSEKKVYSRKTSNQKPWTLSQALDFTKRKLEGDRPLGNSIGALLGSLFCIVARVGGIPILNPNGHTELTVGRPYSGKHVIEVSVVRKATWWRLWKRKAVRICTLVESLLKIERVNRSMTDVATIHFKQNKGMRQRWWVGTDCIQSKLLNQTTQWSSGQRRRGETQSKLKTCKQQFESVLCSKSVAFRLRGCESLHPHKNLIRKIMCSKRYKGESNLQGVGVDC